MCTYIDFPAVVLTTSHTHNIMLQTVITSLTMWEWSCWKALTCALTRDRKALEEIVRDSYTVVVQQALYSVK